MKFNKLYFAAVAFAALALVGCKKPINPADNPSDNTPTEIEIPSIANPAAGQTTIAIYAEVCPRGCYLVGTSNGWAEANDSLLFEAIEGEEHWYKLTIAYDADFQGKVLARPSDEDVPMGWTYQWGKNYDPDDENCPLTSEAENNTIILQGTGEFTFENGGQPKLINVADGGVIYIQVKNWAATPVIEAKKLETCWVKSNFNDADWAWYEMTKVGDGVFEFEGIWGGNGCNINAEGKDDGAAWYANPELIDEPLAGDKVLVTFVSEKMTVGSLSIKLVEAGERPEVEFKDVTVTGIVPEGWDQCYIWAWYGAPSVNVFENWPGQELPIVDGRASYAFEQVGTPLSVIFSNGAGVQTSNIEGITEDAEFVIADYLPAAE